MTDDSFDRSVRRCFADRAAPPHLRSRIVDELASRGLITPRRSAGRHPWRILLAAAIVITAGLLGYFGLRSDRSDGDEKYFALVLDAVSENYSEMAPEQAAALAEQYTRWTDRLRESGRLVESLYLRSTDSTAGIDGVSGIVVVRAETLDELQALIAASPHVARGGTISVREVVRSETLDRR